MRIMQQSPPQPVTPQRRPATPGGALGTFGTLQADTVSRSGNAPTAAAPKARPVRFAGWFWNWYRAGMTLEQAQQALRSGKSVNETALGGNTVLIDAARDGRQDIVKLLLENGAEVNHKNSDGDTALIWAVGNGHRDIVKDLLAKEVDVTPKDSKGHNVLMWAAAKGHTDIAKLLLEKSDINVNLQNQYGATALTLAAGNGHTEIAEKLLEKSDINVNLQNQYGATALMLAVDKGHTEIAEKILEKSDINVNLQNQYGDTALMAAVEKGHTDIAKLLLEKSDINVNLQGEDGKTALMAAALEGHKEIVQMLLDKEANPNLQNPIYGLTALMAAAGGGHKEIVQMLLDKGAKVNLQIKAKALPLPPDLIDDLIVMGYTALTVAKEKGHTEIAALLKKAEEAQKVKATEVIQKWWKKASTAKPQTNSAGPSTTPPHKPVDSKEAFLEAASTGDIDKLKTLLNQPGMDINHKDTDGWTALMSAAAAGHDKVVDLLLDEKLGKKLNKKIDINRKNAAGNTALTLAAASGHLDAVKSLLDKKADIHHQDNNGHTALTSAALNGHHQVADLLLKKGGKIHHKDKNGWTALKWAAEMGHPEVVALLLDNGADTHHQDNDTSSSSGSDDEAPGSSTGASSSRRGEFADYNEYRQARREAKWKLVQGALLAAGCATAGVLAVVCPPVFALGAAMATGTGGLIVSTVQKFFSLTSDLSGNPSFLPQFKEKVQKISNNFKNWVDKHVDPLRKNPRYRPHAEFFIRLSNTLEQFSQNIQDKNYQETMKAALAFERKMLDDMTGHVFSFGKKQDKENRRKIVIIQKFLMKHDQYLSELPKDLDQLQKKDRLRMEHMVTKAGKSNIPELVEWSRNQNSLANQLARMQLRNES